MIPSLQAKSSWLSKTLKTGKAVMKSDQKCSKPRIEFFG